jgi:hypothetical protein
LKTKATSIASEITRLYNEIGEAIAKAEEASCEKAIRIGELLAAKKAKLKHGEWIPWIERNLPFGRAQAANYMRMHEHRDRFKCVTHFTFEKARELLAPGKSTPRNARVKLDRRLDATGIEVPDEILDLWNRTRMKACVLLNEVGTFRMKLSHLGDELFSGMFAEVDLAGCVAKLDRLGEEVEERVEPHAVCACIRNGGDPRDCAACGGRGFVSKFRWKTVKGFEPKNV